MNIYGYENYTIRDAECAYAIGLTVKCDADSQAVEYGMQRLEEEE